MLSCPTDLLLYCVLGPITILLTPSRLLNVQWISHLCHWPIYVFWPVFWTRPHSSLRPQQKSRLPKRRRQFSRQAIGAKNPLASNASWDSNGGKWRHLVKVFQRLLEEKMPPVTATAEEKKDGGEAAPSKPTIGIIYPPPEVRSILWISFQNVQIVEFCWLVGNFSGFFIDFCPYIVTYFIYISISNINSIIWLEAYQKP